MSRWAVRAIGGHDSVTRLPRLLCPQNLRLSRPRLGCTRVDATVPEAVPAMDLDVPIVASSFVECSSALLKDTLQSPSGTSANRIKHRDQCAGRYRLSDPPIDVLMRLLSPENATSDRPIIYPLTIIRSLYYRAESRNQLERLDSNMLSLLIGLFGSLSVDTHTPTVYRSPLASRLLQVSTRRTHWAFVLKVERYMSKRGMTLRDSDRYWLMRAELAQILYADLIAFVNEAYSAVLRARTHYRVIRRHSRHPEVHAYYLETLLAVQDRRLLDLAARDLSFLLRSHHVCHPRLQRLLHHLVIQHGEFLSAPSKETILTALWSRVSEKSYPVLANNTLDLALDGCDLDATVIARTVSATLFGFSDPALNNKPLAVLGQFFSVFCPAHALPLRWSSLVAFSAYNVSETLPSNGKYWTSDLATPEVTRIWKAIFGISSVEKILQETSSAFEMQITSPEGVSETIRALYRLWLSTIKSCEISRDLMYAVATSFLRIAGVLVDATLFHECEDLYHINNNTGAPRLFVPKLFAIQYVVAVVRIHREVALTSLDSFFLDQKQQSQILTSAVQTLAPMDTLLAYQLYTIARAKGIELGSRASHTLAMSFARRGSLHQAVLFFNDGLFSLEERGILLSAIARSLKEEPRIRHPSGVFAVIGDELIALYQSHFPPEHFRGHLEQLFVALAQHGRGTQLVPMVLSILKRSPWFFQPRFFARYCSALIQHGQISSARKLLGDITIVYPKAARPLGILVDRVAVQRASRAFKCTPLRSPASLKLSSRLCCYPYAGPPLEYSLQKLLKSGRILAAKRIFTRVVSTIPPSRCTALGNILIHGVSHQSAPRNGRHVRKVLALLENLVNNHNFRPDRVTVNILIKTLINWRSAFDSARLRGLFDQLVRGGYPAGEYSPLHTPFGTHQTGFTDLLDFSKLSPLVSFEKHSRPLFKMFIKAFYSCNDVEAARKVVGILKVEEFKNKVTKETRQQARSRGRLKAARKNAILLGATAHR